MMPDERRPSEGDLRQYLAARAEATAQQVAEEAMVERVAVGVGLMARRRASRTTLVKVGLVVAALAALLAIGFGAGVITPPPDATIPPSPRTTPSPLAPLGAIDYPGVAIAATDDAVWVTDAAGELAELDPATGSVLRRLQLPRPASALLITPDSIWASSNGGSLVRVDRRSLETTEIAGALGIALAADADAIWLGATDEVIRVDPATNAVALRVPVAQRSPELGIAATDDAVWVGTRSEIVRLDPTSGERLGQIPGDATRIVIAGDRIWAVRGTELLELDPAGVVAGITAGLPASTTIAAAGGRIWIAGPPGGGPTGIVVGIATADPALDVSGVVPGSVLDIAAGAGAVWITTDPEEGGARIVRFALPPSPS